MTSMARITSRDERDDERRRARDEPRPGGDYPYASSPRRERTRAARVPLEARSVQELRLRARELQIPGRSDMRKGELIEAILEQDEEARRSRVARPDPSSR